MRVPDPACRPRAARGGEPGVEQARLLATGLKRARSVEQLLTALRRQAESLRRQAEREGVPIVECHGAQFYRLSTICGATRIAELLDKAAADLDERRPATPARASPARPSLPAPPHHPGSLPPQISNDFGDGEPT